MNPEYPQYEVVVENGRNIVYEINLSRQRVELEPIKRRINKLLLKKQQLQDDLTRVNEKLQEERDLRDIIRNLLNSE